MKLSNNNTQLGLVALYLVTWMPAYILGPLAFVTSLISIPLFWFFMNGKSRMFVIFINLISTLRAIPELYILGLDGLLPALRGVDPQVMDQIDNVIANVPSYSLNLPVFIQVPLVIGGLVVFAYMIFYAFRWYVWFWRSLMQIKNRVREQLGIKHQAI